MVDRPTDREASPEVAEELRTIGFRLRELQRLLSIRVEQENRRLAADGIDQVSESRFFREAREED